ncbi:MAG: hypothetical protein INH05_21260, partial [Burkholderiales bacterium]|nr:hypothetical protein [Burkholderiales bacterium]
RLAAAAAGLRGPDLALRAARVDAASRALGATMRGRLDALVQRVGHAGAELDLVSPSAVLARGYAIVTGPHGAIVRSAGAVAPGDAVSVALGDGGFDARVTATAAAGKAVSDAGTD